MKSIFYYTLWLMLVIAGVANAQAPSQFNYQAVARDASGTPYANKTITVQIKILDGSSSGSQVYAEVHNNVVTNTYGLFNLAIGSKASGGLSLASVNWGVGSKYIEVSIDPAGGTNVVKIGDAQLLSVPYAIYSNTAGNALSGGSGGASSLIGGTGISISGNTISGLNTSNIWNAGQLQGRDVSATGPSDGSLLVYQQSQGIWSPSLVGTSLIKGGGGTIVQGDFLSGLTISSPAINFTTGTGISINNGVISNILPDQTVTFVNSATTSITGTYPNFTILSAPTQARTLTYTVATNTLSILGGTVPVVFPGATSSNDGLMTINQVNTLQSLSSLSGLDIKTSNPATLSVSKLGSVYTLSVPTTPGSTLNFDQTTSTLSISNGNSIVIPTANASNAGLQSASDFNALQNIKGVNVVSGSSNVSVSSLPGPVFSVSVSTPTAQTLTISGNNTLGLTGGSSSPVTINDANGSTSGLMSATSFNNLTTLSTLLGFDIQGVPGNTIVTRSGSLYTISVPSSVPPVFGTVGQSSTPAISIAGLGSVTGGNLTIDIADANGTNSGLLSSSNFNNLTTLSTLLGFDIQGVPGNTIVIRSGSLYTISVPSTIAPTYGTIGSSTAALTISGSGSVVGTNLNISIQDVNATNSGLMTSSDFVKLSTLSGITINNGVGIAVTGAYPNFTVTNTATGTFSQWTTTGSDIFFNGGNVGIGTSSPNAQLSVAGSTAISGNLTIAGLSGSGLRRVGVNNNGELIVVTTGAGLTTDLKSVTPALDIQNGKDAVVGTLPVTISIALATATSDGLLSATDFNKLQTITGASGSFSTLTGVGGSLTVDNTFISNPTIVVSTVSGTNAGVLLPADYTKLQSLQNVSVAGLGVTTTLGPNGLTFVIPASGSGTVTTVTGVGPISVATGGTTPIITIATASGVNSGVIIPADYTKLQTLQNISVAGIGVTTTTGPNGLTYVIPASSSNTTSIVGIGLTVTTLAGNTYQITNTFTSSGVGYFAASPGLTVSSTSGAIALDIASVNGFGILSSSEYAKLQGLQNVSVGGFGITTTTGPNGLTYIIPAGGSGTVTTVTGVGPISVATGGTTPIITIATASGVNSGVILPADYTKLQTLQNVSVAGLGVTTTVGPNGLTYVIPASSSNTTSIVGIGLTVTTLAGNTYQITNTYTSAGVGYYSTSPGLFVSSVSGALGLAVASVNGYGILSALDYIKLQTSTGVTLVAGNNINITTGTGGIYTITGTPLVGSFTTVTGVLPVSISGSTIAPVISVALATATSDGLLSSTDFNRLQTLTGIGNALTTSTIFGGDISGTYNSVTVSGINNTPITNVPSINGQVLQYNGGVLTFATIPGASATPQTLTLVGNNLSISGGNFVTLPTSTTSIVGVGLSVTTLGGNTFQITNTYTSAGIGYYTTSPGLSVSSTTGLIGLNFNQTSVVGTGVSLISTVGGFTTYSIGGIASQWTTTGLNDIYFTGGKVGINTATPNANFSVIGNASISGGIVTSALKLTTLSTGGTRWIGVDALGNVILVPTLNTTSAGLSINSVTGSINLVSSNSSYTTTTPGLIISTALGTININTANNTGNGLLSFTDWTTFNNKLSAVTLSGANGISISPSSIGSNFVISGSGQTSVVGTNVSVISTIGGITTYSVGGSNLVSNPWSTTTGFIYSLNNTSISGISSVAGLNIRSISSVSGAYLGINANGVVGTIAGSSFVSPTLSLSGLNTLSISGGNSVLLPITTLVGSGISKSTSTVTGITTYTINGISQWVTDSDGIYYNGGNVSIGDPTSYKNVGLNISFIPTTVSSTNQYYGTFANVDVSSVPSSGVAGTGYGYYGQVYSGNSIDTTYGVYAIGGSAGTNYGGFFSAFGGGLNYGLVVSDGNLSVGSIPIITPDKDRLLMILGDYYGFTHANSLNQLSTYLEPSTTVAWFGTDTQSDLRLYVDYSKVGLTISADPNYSGFVGIGRTDAFEQLDVDGGIRIGLAYYSNAGTIQFDGTSFQGYDGTQWINFGNGSSQWINDANGINFNAGNIALGSSSNTTNQFSIVNDNVTSLTGTNLSIINYNNSPSFGGSISLAHVIGSASSPQNYGGGEVLGEISFNGFYGGNLYAVAGVKGTVPNKWNNVSYNSGLEFYTTPVGSVTPVTAFGVGAESQLHLSSIVQPSGGNTKIGDLYSDGTSLYYYNGVWNDLLSGGSNQWTTLGGFIYANYGTSISGISTVGGFNIQNIAGVTGAVALGINPLTGEVGTIAGTSLVSTSVVGLGVTLITSPGLNTYSIAGTSSISQWTTSGTNILATYNTSISGISSVAGLNLRSISSVSGSYLGLNSSGVVGTIAGPAFSITSVSGFGITSSTVGNVTTYTINQTSVVGLNVSTTTGPNGFTTYSIGGLSSSFTTLTGLALASVTGGLGNYTITGLYPTLTLNGANLSVVGSGLPVVSLPLASVVGLNVSTVTGPTGFTTYSILGTSLTNPWSTSTGFIYALNNTSISGISSVAGLNIRAITSVSGALLGIGSNGSVGTIAGVASQWSSSLSTTPGIFYNTGNVGIGTSSPNKNAVIDISSSTQGALFPRMTTVQRTTFGLNLGLTDDGMLVYDTDLKSFINWYATPTSSGWSGGGNNNSNSSGNLAWIYNSTGTGLVTLNPIYSGVTLSTTVAGTTLLTVNGGQLNTSTITTNGLNLSNLTGTGVRAAVFDASGNLFASTLGYITGGNTNASSGVAFFTGAGSTITTNPSFVWDNVNSKLGIGTASPQSALDVNYAGTASGISVFLQNSTGSQAALVAKVSGSSAQSTALYTESSISGANIIMANRDPNTTLFKVTTNGQVQIGILTGTGTRFVQADAAGNLSATTLSGFVQGANTSTATSLAFFTGQNSSVTGTNNLTWNNTSSILGVNGNISLITPNAGGAGGAVLVQMFTPVAIATGAIVIVDPTTDNQIVTSNQQGSTSAVGVIVGTCNASSYCNVAISGVVKVQSTTAIRGQHCITSTVAGFADSIPSPDPGSSIGVYISNASGGFANVLLK